MILQPLLNTRYPRDHLHVATSVLTDAPRSVVLRPTGYQPCPQPTSSQVPTGRLPATNQPSTTSAIRPAGHNINNKNHNNKNNNNTNTT